MLRAQACTRPFVPTAAPQELVSALALIHSYVIVRGLVARDDHAAAARMLVRVAQSISRWARGRDAGERCLPSGPGLRSWTAQMASQNRQVVAQASSRCLLCTAHAANTP
jgi:hypothetical protein